MTTENPEELVELWTCRCGKTMLPEDFPEHKHEPEPSPFYLLTDDKTTK